jgi:hypothetical protein
MARPNVRDFLRGARSVDEANNAFVLALRNAVPPEPGPTAAESLIIVQHFATNDSSPIGNGISALAALAGSQEQTGAMPGFAQEYTKLESIIDGLVNKSGNLKSAGEIALTLFQEAGKQFLLTYQQQSELLGIINKQAGLTGQYSKDVRDELTKANPELLRIGIGFADLANAAKSLIDNTGKFLTMNAESWYKAGESASAYVGTLQNLVDMFPEFQKIGIGAGDVAKQIDIVGGKSLSLGLQSQKTVKELNLNLSKLNEFGFKNGIQGMAEMVRKSTEFRISMDSVFTVAEKVFNPEGAIDMAANLQAIGGAIGDFNDPLKLMYMATNNVEGLQEALIGVTQSLATYNEEQGRFEVTGVNLRKARALAEQLGMSYGELANGAIAAAERSSAATSLLSRGLDLKPDQQEFLTNLAQMEGGKMTIELNSNRLKEALGVGRDTKEIALENLTQAQANTLYEYQKELKEKTPKEIVISQATNIENITRDVNYLLALARTEAGKSGKDFIKFMGVNPEELAKQTKIYADEGAKKIKDTGENPFTGIKPIENQNKNINAVPIKSDTYADKFDKKEKPNPAPGEQGYEKKVSMTINHTFKSDGAVMDNLYRYVVNNPTTWNDIKPEEGDYTYLPFIGNLK